MSSSKEITGGTGDVNPQILLVPVTQSAADVATTVEVILPIARLPTRKGRAIVFELLKVYGNFGTLLGIASSSSLRALVSTSLQNAVAQPRTFYIDSIENHQQSAVGFQLQKTTHIVDFTDGAGHGLLIATDTLFCELESTITSTTNSYTWRFLYRFKEVDLVEYIGIVQSQQ